MRILMTMFGWRESGGGTIYPRLLARHLAARGHEVLVIYAALPRLAGAAPYSVLESEEDGVRLAGIHNRPSFFLDEANPEREISDPEISRIVRHYLDSFAPEVVHYHNFLGLSMGFVPEVHERGLPSFFSLHNFWLLCPTLYLFLPDSQLCAGVDELGGNCLSCTRAALHGSAYRSRNAELRSRSRSIDRLLVGAPKIADILVQQGYEPERIEVLALANQRAEQVWQSLGEQRPLFAGGSVRFGFMGSVIPLKGIETLVRAAQLVEGDFGVDIYGEISPDYAAWLKAIDPHNRIVIHPPFEGGQLPDLLSRITVGVVPSLCHEQAGLVVGEFLGARVPVIVSDAGGLSHYLRPPESGRVFRTGDVESLAAAMQELVRDPELIRRMQQAILPPLSFGAYLDALEGMYAQGIGASAGRRRERAIQQFQGRRHLSLTARIHDLPGGAIYDWRPDGPTTPEPADARTWVPLEAWLEQLPGSDVRMVPFRIPDSTAAPSFELPADKPCMLGFVPAGSAAWTRFLQAFWGHFGPDDDVALVLVPWQQSLDALYETLLADIEAAGLDPAIGPELVLLDPDDIGEAWPELAAQAEVYLGIESFERAWPHFITGFQSALLAVAEPPPPPYDALLQARSPNGDDQAWLQSQGLRLLRPDHPAIARHNDSLDARLIESP